MSEDINIQIEEYKKKLIENPNSLIFLPLAQLYRKTGMLDDAIIICKRGLEIHPTYTGANVLLSRIYVEKQMYQEALNELESIVHSDSSNIMANVLLREVYEKLGRNLDAQKTLEKITTLQRVESVFETNSHKDEMLTSTIAEIYVKQGLVNDAIQIYQKILEAEPRNEKARIRLNELMQQKILKPTLSDEKTVQHSKKEQMQNIFKEVKKHLDNLKSAIEKIEKEM
ncbi:MAG: tetratricopeptide repeat protein [Candidatus Firestonebacteria bacterium]